MRARVCSRRCRGSKRQPRTCVCVCAGARHGEDVPTAGLRQTRFEFEFPLPFPAAAEGAVTTPINGLLHSQAGREVGLVYANEACATCGIPRDLHLDRHDPPCATPHTVWGDRNACRTFVRCDPPRAAYGELIYKGNGTMRPIPGSGKRHGIATVVREAIPTLPQPFTLRQLADTTGYTIATVNGPVQRMVVSGDLVRNAVEGKKLTTYTVKSQ